MHYLQQEYKYARKHWPVYGQIGKMTLILKDITCFYVEMKYRRFNFAILPTIAARTRSASKELGESGQCCLIALIDWELI